MFELPRECLKINGMETDQALWLTLAAETAASLHWPKGVHPSFAARLATMREMATRFTDAANYVVALLAVEEAEGVEAELVDCVFDIEDDDAEDRDDQPEEDEGDERWRVN